MRTIHFILIALCIVVCLGQAQNNPDESLILPDRQMGVVIPDSVREYWQTHKPQLSYDPKALLASVDWSINDSPVKDQGGCGSCWAFAAVALLENLGVQNDLSEQKIVSCVSSGCSGGWPGNALAYVYQHGLPPEDCLPYAASNGACPDGCTTPRFLERIDSYVSTLWGQPADLNDIKAALQTGPLAVVFAIYSDFYYNYSSGIYHHTGGSYVGLHAVLLVGYDDAQSCFKVKNSWGTWWGESGYFRISYDEAASEVIFGSYASSASGVHTELQPPFITGTSPERGQAGSQITVNGGNFSSTPANNSVYFGGVKAAVVSSQQTSMTVTVPAGFSQSPLTVTANDLTGYAREPFAVTYPASMAINNTSFSPRVDFSPARSIAFADFDLDGKPDLACANSSGGYVSVFRNAGSAGSITSSTFPSRTDFAAGNWPFSIGIGDIDGDGKLDLGVANESGNNVSVLRNTSSPGSISFATQVQFATGTNPGGTTIADFDRDGRPDIVVSNRGNTTVSVLRNITTGNTPAFETKVDFVAGSAPRGIAVADIDGDGLVDIAVTLVTTNAVVVLRNTSVQGAFSFDATSLFGTPGSPQIAAFGDLNADHRPDLVVGYSGSNSIGILQNTSTPGVLGFELLSDINIGAASRSIAIGDLSGDGRADVAVSSSANQVSVLRSISNGSSILFAPRVDFATGSNPWLVTLTDIDADGYLDIGTANGASSSVSLLRNTGLPPAPRISVTIQADPQEYYYPVWLTVDGVVYPGHQTFDWEAGSVHTIEASELQENNMGRRVVWSSWSDGGARTHTIQPLVASTYTANYDTMYYLAMDPGSAMEVMPPSGFYPKDSCFSIFAGGTWGPTHYAGWVGRGVGSYTGPEWSAQICMLGPIEQSAIYYPCNFVGTPTDTSFDQTGGNGTHRIVTYSDCSIGTSSNQDWLIVDSTVFHAGVDPETTGTYIVYYHLLPNPDLSTRDAVVFVWGYRDPDYFSIHQAGTNSVSVNLHSQPSGQTISVDGGTYTTPHVFVWEPNSVHSISTAFEHEATSDTRYRWDRWSDGGTISHSITISQDTAITAYYDTLYYLALVPTDSCLLSPGSGFYLKDTCFTISTWYCPDYRIQPSFLKWVGTGNGSYSGYQPAPTICMRSPIQEVSYYQPCQYWVLSADTTLYKDQTTGVARFQTYGTCEFYFRVANYDWIFIDSVRSVSGLVPEDPVTYFVNFHVSSNLTGSERSDYIYGEGPGAMFNPIGYYITQLPTSHCPYLNVDTSVTATPGSSVWLPVHVQPGSSHVGSIDFTMTYGAANLTYADSFRAGPIVPVSDGWVLSVTHNAAAKTVTVGATDFSGVTNPLTGSGVFLYVKFNVGPGAVPGTDLPVSLSGLAATDTAANPICLEGVNGYINVVNTVTLSGNLWYYKYSKALIGDTVRCWNAGLTYNQIDLSKPWFTLGAIPYQSTDTLRPQKIRGGFTQPGTITSGDALKAFRGRPGGPGPVLTPMEKLAADVNGDCAITSGDALAILRRATGSALNFFGRDDWRFVDSSFSISDANWCTAPDARYYSNLTANAEGQSFFGIVRGDLDGNYGTQVLLAATEKPETPSQFMSDVLFSVPTNLTGDPGDTIEIPISINPNGNQLGSFDVTMAFDTAVVRYLDFTRGPIVPAGWLVDVNGSNASGTVSVGAADFTLSSPVSASGVAISCRFLVNPSAVPGDTTALPLTGLAATDPEANPLSVTGGAGKETVLPIQLTAFHATVSEGNIVHLEWMTVSEVNNHGFYVERRSEIDQQFRELPNSFVPGNGTTLEPHAYTWNDLPVQAGTYYYRLRQVDLDGAANMTYEIVITVTTPLDVDDGGGVPRRFVLHDNYPNPFNPTTTIRYELPSLCKVTVTVYDILGNKVATLADESQTAGVRSLVWNASGKASGLYILQVTAIDLETPSRSFAETKRMVLMK